MPRLLEHRQAIDSGSSTPHSSFVHPRLENPREEYVTDEGIAIIGKWRRDPAHPPHLIRLSHIYEDEDDPQSKLTESEMWEVVEICTETAEIYRRHGPYDLVPFLRACAQQLYDLLGKQKSEKTT